MDQQHRSPRTCLGQKCRWSKFLLCLLDSSRFFKSFIAGLCHRIQALNPSLSSVSRASSEGGRKRISVAVTCRPSMFPGHPGITKACTQHSFCLLILSLLTCSPVAFSSCPPHSTAHINSPEAHTSRLMQSMLGPHHL